MFSHKVQNGLKPKQIRAFGDKEIEEGFDISMVNIYKHSTRTTDINYTCKFIFSIRCNT